MVKNLPAMWETQFQSLDRENPLEKEIAAHSSILAWRIPRTEELGGLQPMGSQRASAVWATNTDWLTEAGNVFVPQINFALLTSETLFRKSHRGEKGPGKIKILDLQSAAFEMCLSRHSVTTRATIHYFESMSLSLHCAYLTPCSSAAPLCIL